MAAILQFSFFHSENTLDDMKDFWRWGIIFYGTDYEEGLILFT